MKQHRRRVISSRTCRSLLVACTLLLMLSCDVTDVCGCPPARSHGIVYGTVASATGQPVSGALLRTVIFRSVCDTGPQPGDYGVAGWTDATGAYRLHLFAYSGHTPACVRLTARRQSAADSAIVYLALTMRYEGERPDSVRADVIVP